MRNVRITLGQIIFRTPFRAGPHTVAITAEIDGEAVGPDDYQPEVRNRRTLALPEEFRKTLDADARPIESGRPKPIDVTLTVRMAESGNTRRVGRVTLQLRWPFLAQDQQVSCAAFLLRLRLAVPEDAAAAGAGPAADVCRDTPDGTMCSTVAGVETLVRVEAHEVLPQPTGGSVPNRPAFPAAAPAAFTDGRGVRGADILADGPVNIIENPPVIPIMPRDTELDETNCAKFRVTYVRPGDLNLLEDGDDRLEWRCVPIAGGEATFFGPTDGRKVKLHGVTRGEVGLELRFRGVLVAVYRALVLPLVRIPSRINIL